MYQSWSGSEEEAVPLSGMAISGEHGRSADESTPVQPVSHLYKCLFWVCQLVQDLVGRQ